MKNNFTVLFRDRRIKQFTWINSLTLIVFIFVTIWKWTSLPPQLPLFYSLPRSTDQLGTPVLFIGLLFFSTLFSVMNFYIASVLYTKERLAALILTGMSTTVSFLLLVTFIKIVFLLS